MPPIVLVNDPLGCKRVVKLPCIIPIPGGIALQSLPALVETNRFAQDVQDGTVETLAALLADGAQPARERWVDITKCNLG